MDFSGFGGVALAVLAGLWFLVFVPSWFKRAQDSERGIVSAPRVPIRALRTRRQRNITRRNSVDNFNQLAGSLEELGTVEEVEDSRAWNHIALPAPLAFKGVLEVPQFAEVLPFEGSREAMDARKLEQSELDEILRRRRATG